MLIATLKRQEHTSTVYEITVELSGHIAGYLRRNVVQVPARRAFYPYTTDKVEWWARSSCMGTGYQQFPTRKAAIAFISDNCDSPFKNA